MRIGVRSWNQDCACTKPCTRRFMARGFMSCATKEEQPVVHGLRVQFRQQRVLRRRVEGDEETIHDGVVGGVAEEAPVVRRRRCHLGLEEADQRGEGVVHRVGHVDRGDAARRQARAPSRHRPSSAFHSTTSKSISIPTSLRFCCTASFIGRGCIWPEPEGEIATLVRSGLRAVKPASASSRRAAATSVRTGSLGGHATGGPAAAAPRPRPSARRAWSSCPRGPPRGSPPGARGCRARAIPRSC